MLRRVAVLAVAVAVSVPAPAAQASATEPDYEMPFPCMQKWLGTTRSSHSPSVKAIDFNRRDDLNDLVSVSAPGVVSRVADLGRRSYGTYVVVDHGNGRSSLYAHLAKAWVVPGQAVDQGMVLGQVGATGAVSGPHLHFEQRVNAVPVTARFHGTPFVMGTNQASTNCPDVPVAGDWNGDGRAEVGVFRRTPSASFQRQGSTVLALGRITDDPVVGDWDGNGSTDAGVRRGLSQRFLLARPDGTKLRLTYGQAGDRPISGDWDGDGKDEIGLFRPATGLFMMRSATGVTTSVRLGSAATLPVTGDWNGDGRTDLGAFDPATTVWTLRYVDAEGTPWTASVTFGAKGDLPVAGDWDGDGRTNLGTWTPATATYSLRRGAATRVDARAVPRQFGTAR